MYWKTSVSESQEKVGQELDAQASNIRSEIQQFADLGKIPKIVFVFDKQMSSLTMPTSEEIQRLLAYQTSETVSSSSNNSNDELAESEVTNEPKTDKYCDTDPNSSKMRTDSLRLDRKKIMDKILTSIEKSQLNWGKYE